MKVLAARYLLQSFGLYGGVRITSCPTCGRCKWDLRQYVQRLEKDTIHLKKSIHIAMMGCEVNGPGRSRQVQTLVWQDPAKKQYYLRAVKSKKQVQQKKSISFYLVRFCAIHQIEVLCR